MLSLYACSKAKHERQEEAGRGAHHQKYGNGRAQHWKLASSLPFCNELLDMASDGSYISMPFSTSTNISAAT
jgi:hypothetical protein